MNNQQRKPIIIGLGTAGVKIINVIAKQKINKFDLAAIDTDASSFINLSESVIPVFASGNKPLTAATGAGGSTMFGEQAIGLERKNITEQIRNRPLALIVCGLGGGTATGSAPILANIAKNVHVPAIFLVTMPFAFESLKRRKPAESCVKNLLSSANLVINLPNDLLFAKLDAATPAEEAMQVSGAEIARTAAGIALMLSNEYNFNANFSTMMSMLNGKNAECSIGVGLATAADGDERCQKAISRMLESPFLGGPEAIAQADALIFSIAASKSLQIGELKRGIEIITKMAKPQTLIESGFSSDDFMGESLQVVLIAVSCKDELQIPQIETDKLQLFPRQNEVAPVKEEKRKIAKKNKLNNTPGQIMFEMPTYEKGIFKVFLSQAAKVGDEDWDIPSFQRNGQDIDSDSNLNLL